MGSPSVRDWGEVCFMNVPPSAFFNGSSPAKHPFETLEPGLNVLYPRRINQ